MLAIRLARVGAKKQAAYRVVVMEKSRARDSRSVEIIGHYNPRNNPTTIELKQERIEYWMSKGAQPSDRVTRLIKMYKERPAEPVAEKPAAEKPTAPEAKAAASEPKAAPEAKAPEAKAPEAKEPEAAAEAKAAEPAADAAPADEAEPKTESASEEEPKPTG